MSKILLTGATGFLGRIIGQELNRFEIISIGRSKSDINCDLSISVPDLPTAQIVIHSAGKAHVVPKTEQERNEFYRVNVVGTQNLLTALEHSKELPKAFVFISSVAVYGLEIGSLINEEAPLLASDPYGESKVRAEKLIETWCNRNNVICAILRLPLIAGPNPPGNLKSMISGIARGYYFNIAGANAKKSIVLAIDVAAVIPRVSEIGGIYNLTDSYHPSFKELSIVIAKQLEKAEPSDIPLWLAKIIGRAGDLLGRKAPLNTNKLVKMTADLTFDDSKAFQVLNWLPTSVLKGFKIK